MTVRTIALGEQTYLALANDTPYPIRLDTLVNAPAAALVDDLGRGMRLKPEATPDGRHLVLDLLPFGVAAPADRRAAGPGRRGDALSHRGGQDKHAGTLQRALRPVVAAQPQPRRRPDRPPQPGVRAEQRQDGPADRGPPRGRACGAAVPLGWQVVGNPGQHRRDRLGAVPLGTGQPPARRPGPPGAVVSDRFVPDVQTSLTIQAWLRSDQPDAKVRVWIEGESAGQPFVRRSELTIPTEWSAMAVRTSEIPPAGLTGARLRFELLSPGRLWVDDLSLAGEALSETERLNAQRALVAALQAYREKRYADFARLAGSHWARLPAVVGVAGGDGRAPTDPGPGMIRTGGTTALPPDRRLR